MNAKLFNVCLLTAGVLLASASPANAIGYTFTNLTTPGGSFSYAADINNSGQVAGYALYQSGGYSATVWNGTTPTRLESLGFSMANDINDSGQVTGWRTRGGSVSHQAVIWDGDTLTTLEPLFYNQPRYGNAINNFGQVAGSAGVHDHAAGLPLHATVWNGTTPTDLGTLGGIDSYATDINNAGQVVGYASVASAPNTRVYHAIVWNGTTPTDLDAAGGDQRSSEAFGINDSGQIVGMSELNAGRETHATLWNGTTPTDLGTLDGGYSSSALGINNSSQVVGWSTDSNGNTHATIWNGTTPTDLNDFLSLSEVNAGWVLDKANGINDNGWIVGNAHNNLTGVDHAFLLTPVPEPETYALFMTGLGLMGFIARRRKNGQA